MKEKNGKLPEDEKRRRRALAAAALLGLAGILYLSGLLAQLRTGYRSWMAEGGMAGQSLMPPVSLNPLRCWRCAFSLTGVQSILFLLLLAGASVLYVKLHDRFGGKNPDERNFSRSDRGTYGTAGWMGDQELRDVLEVASPAKARGIILGKRQNGDLICLPEDTRLNKHVAVFGASGTMKSRGVIRPALFQSIRRGESVVVTDPKSEIYSDTVELFRKHGYTVRVYNLLQPQHSDSWNCMFDLNGDTLMAQVLTDVIIANTKGDGKGDHFWDNGEANLLKSMILYVDQDPSRGPEERNLPAVYQMLTQTSEKQLGALFDRLPLSHPAKAPYNLFSQASDNVRAGIILGLGTRLQVLQSEAARQITKHSDIDLAEPGKSKCIYYIILDDQNSSLEFLSSLFFAFLFIKLVRYADSTPEQRCKVPVNIILDEMNNIGVIPDFGRRLSTIRSRSLQVLMACQNLPQIQNRYPNNLWAELLGNADTQLMLGCTDDVTAEFISARSGDMTVEVNSTMTTRQSIAVAQVIPQYRYTEGLGRRRLLTPDEVLRLPNDQVLIIIRGQKILRAWKFDYTGHPYAREMSKTSIQEFVPCRLAESAPSEPRPPVTAMAISPLSEPPDAPPPVSPPPELEAAKPVKRRPALYESAAPPEDF
ncbi:VirD4-like conjugal transfer protein, CD1115 family [uncultured Oscillibacter sp.]|uniref:VirD4-like conjugal transfer protein, CD1115 family n=1 Tax=uncultured Oscillibacter sp. TaxID=876091 RepID=UPI002628482E|nr:type IV secretory system conjugative DNA transfer family protein [uncultured Oscillibacter sp.]